ncbi:MAG TPA: S66 peptidase family protein [Candidatus Acidoferrales bacterium]|nr:S66 peptidase family protein [Candidatus Acidoferrales bacterium]
MIPPKLKKGDEIRIVAPATSMDVLSEETKRQAVGVLESLGYKITFGKRIYGNDGFDSTPIADRVADLHDAFEDKNVKALSTVLGGFNSNQLLPHLDYELIRQNPKILCGYSDITVLHNAIYKKTGLVSYNGPHFASFGMKRGAEYTIEYFRKCLESSEPFDVLPSAEWSNDRWYLDQENRTFVKNEGFRVINEGDAEGRILGGNLCTFNLLHGTEYMPDLRDSIIFLEDDYYCHAKIFDRDLQSLTQQPGFDGVKGIVIGRFEKASQLSIDAIEMIVKSKRELDNIPVIAGVDFSHTTPQITFPIGGTARMLATGKEAMLRILEH